MLEKISSFVLELFELFFLFLVFCCCALARLAPGASYHAFSWYKIYILYFEKMHQQWIEPITFRSSVEHYPNWAIKVLHLTGRLRTILPNDVRIVAIRQFFSESIPKNYSQWWCKSWRLQCEKRVELSDHLRNPQPVIRKAQSSRCYPEKIVHKDAPRKLNPKGLFCKAESTKPNCHLGLRKVKSANRNQQGGISMAES